MNTSCDSIARAEIRHPSMRRCGTRSMISRSLNAPGSDSSALMTRYVGGSLRTKLALRPVGKPAPPRPRPRAAPPAGPSRPPPARVAVPAGSPTAAAGTRSRSPEFAPPGSPVDLAHDRVEGADDRDEVGHERVAHAGRGRLERDERRRAELDPPRLRPAVGDDVATQLAARGLHGNVDLALGHAIALGDELEMVDERLHRRVQLMTWRQHDLAVVGDPRALGHPVEALLDDPHRLAHLVHVHAVPGVDVSLRIDRHVEIDVWVGEVRLVAAQVPVDAPAA